MCLSCLPKMCRAAGPHLKVLCCTSMPYKLVLVLILVSPPWPTCVLTTSSSRCLRCAMVLELKARTVPPNTTWTWRVRGMHQASSTDGGTWGPATNAHCMWHVPLTGD